MAGDEKRRGVISGLLAGVADPVEQARAGKRVAARLAWARDRLAALSVAQQATMDAWDRLLDADPEAEEAPPESAAEQLIWEEIDAVRRHDRWPRHLHWGDV